jgi:hypothetical protein
LTAAPKRSDLGLRGCFIQRRKVVVYVSVRKIHGGLELTCILLMDPYFDGSIQKLPVAHSDTLECILQFSPLADETPRLHALSVATTLRACKRDVPRS